jgi:hypothetical protein
MPSLIEQVLSLTWPSLGSSLTASAGLATAQQHIAVLASAQNLMDRTMVFSFRVAGKYRYQ